MLILSEQWRIGSWASGKFLRVLNLDSFKRSWCVNQLHAMSDDFFWNSSFRIAGFIQLLYSLWKGSSHCLLYILIYHCGYFYFLLSHECFWFNFFICCGCLLAQTICQTTKMAWCWWRTAYHMNISVVHFILLVFYFSLIVPVFIKGLGSIDQKCKFTLFQLNF